MVGMDLFVQDIWKCLGNKKHADTFCFLFEYQIFSQ